MTLFLIRHGHAGSRKNWDADDEERPLSAKGEAQAAWIAEQFAGAGITRVLSSSYLRCVQTVEPLADRLGLEVEPHPALTEGASAKAGLRLLDELAGGTAALCSHGDVIPAVVKALHKRGVDADGNHDSAKGGTFVLDTANGKIVCTRYLPPGR